MNTCAVKCPADASQSKQFFKSPPDDKAEYAVSSKGSGKNGGWFGMNAEKLDPEKQKVRRHLHMSMLTLQRGDFKECVH
jgi:hypothetical protein